MNEVEIRATHPRTYIEAIQEKIKEGYILKEEAGIYQNGKWEFIAILRPATIIS